MNSKYDNEKPINKVMIGTRNKAVVLYSKIFGHEKTNEILEKTFSSNRVISKILEAEEHKFEILSSSKDNVEWVCLKKEIIKLGIDDTKCYEKYWSMVRDNLLLLYDEELTDAIMEHYQTLVVDGNEQVYFIISGIREDKPDAENEGLCIEFHLNDVLKYSNIEKELDNKIIKYKINSEEILSIFIDSLIQVFG